MAAGSKRLIGMRAALVFLFIGSLELTGWFGWAVKILLAGLFAATVLWPDWWA